MHSPSSGFRKTTLQYTISHAVRPGQEVPQPCHLRTETDPVFVTKSFSLRDDGQSADTA
jgi:hypothetical protein